MDGVGASLLDGVDATLLDGVDATLLDGVGPTATEESFFGVEVEEGGSCESSDC